MKINNIVLKMTAVMVVILGFIGCDDDYGTVGSNIIGDNNFDTFLYDESVINTTNYNLTSVQTNQLTGNLLGVYNDPVYGQKVANILTQISLSEDAPTFGVDPVLDSVVLTIPYYYRQTGQNSDNEAVYELDSIYGNSPYNLSIVQSNYFLNDFDPGTDFEQRQKYFSDQQDEIENNLSPNVLFSESFVPSAESVVTIVGEEEEADTIVQTPRLRIVLPVDFFAENIINKEGSMELLNNNNFKNFIRGLYFKAEPLQPNGNMLLLNFTHEDAGIMLYYSHQVESEDTESTETVSEQSTFTIGFNGIRFNTFNNSFTLPEDDNLYLSGGAGAMTVIELFTEEQLEELRANDWLINEANLTFFVNQDAVTGGNTEPERIYLYDFDNNSPIIDYFYDVSGPTNDPGNAKQNHLGILQRDESENGISYKLKLTDHIHYILNNDSTNVKLGLVVASNVSTVSMSTVKDIVEVEQIPSTSLMTPKGTVLYGPNTPVEAKRLKLNIYYTETEVD